MKRIDTNRPGVKNDNQQSTFIDHLLNQLGSTWNPDVFVLAGGKINGVKARVGAFEAGLVPNSGFVTN